EADALREASYFVERLSEESMPLSGLVANRTHPVLADLTAIDALAAAEALEKSETNAPLAAAVLRLHADRVQLEERESRLLERFTRAHPGVPVRRAPALAADVHDIDGLRDIGARRAGACAARRPPRPPDERIELSRSRPVRTRAWRTPTGPTSCRPRDVY